ncbi:MAG: YHS domain-containing (seleno)protein [Cyanobacteria bacterium J06639_1]
MNLPLRWLSVSTAALGLIAIASCGSPASKASDAPIETAEVVEVVDASETQTRPAATLASADTAAPQSVEPPLAVFTEAGVAIRGADVVAYFTDGAYVPGSPEFTYEWGDAVWQFASAANRDAFAANPVQYAPQYGGFCAWAVSQGYTAAVDPTAWKIVDGKLYLNFNASVQNRWARDIPGNIAKGDRNWPSVLSN